MTKVDTLKNLNVEVGDVVEYGPAGSRFTVKENEHLFSHKYNSSNRYPMWNTVSNFKVISRCTQEVKSWCDLSDEEKGALLLAHHDGETIEYYSEVADEWLEDLSFDINEYPELQYRVKAETVAEEVKLFGYGKGYWVFGPHNDGPETHSLTFNLVDGQPDCSSIKMESL